ncbi:DUF6537 domain-containing protein, partial [Acinetobacter baumannii]
WGRLASASPDRVARALGGEPPAAETLDQMIARRVAFLVDYQDAAYAERYRARIAAVRRAEAPLGSEALTAAVARSLFK